MTDVQTLYVSEAAPVPADVLRELSRVELTVAVVGDDGATVPAGSVGTVVAVWAHGAAYEVEFVRPVQELATVRADGLRPV